MGYWIILAVCWKCYEFYQTITAKKTQLRYDMDSGGELSGKGSEAGKSGGEEKKKKKKGMLPWIQHSVNVM